MKGAGGSKRDAGLAIDQSGVTHTPAAMGKVLISKRFASKYMDDAVAELRGRGHTQTPDGVQLLNSIGAVNRKHLGIKKLQAMLKAEGDAAGDKQQYIPCRHVPAVPRDDEDDDDK